MYVFVKQATERVPVEADGGARLFETGHVLDEGVVLTVTSADTGSFEVRDVHLRHGALHGGTRLFRDLLQGHEKVYVGIHRTQGPTARADLQRGAGRMLQEATVNLRILAYLTSLRPLAAEDRMLVLHYRSAFGPELLPDVAAWEAFLELRDELSRDGRLPRDKLLTYLRPAALDTALPWAVSQVVERTHARANRFNYVPMSLVDCIDLARDNAVEVQRIHRLHDRWRSSLVRVYRGGNTHQTHLLVSKDLPELQQAFFILYELCHLLRDLDPLDRLPDATPAEQLLSLPPDLMPPQADRSAEMFALIGLLPTPEVAWQFRAELHEGATWQSLVADRGRLTPPAEQRILGALHPTLRPTLTVPEPHWHRSMRRNFVRRLRSVFRYAGQWTQSLTQLLPDRGLSQDEADAIAGALPGACWARIDPQGRLVAASDPYVKFVGVPRDQLLGRPVSELADARTRARIPLVEAERNAANRPVCYHFGFKKTASDREVVAARVMTWPVRGPAGEPEGAFGIVETLAPGAQRPRWPGRETSSPPGPVPPLASASLRLTPE